MVVPKVKGEEDGLVYTPDDKTSINALGVASEVNVVCKCERVTEAEIVEALRRSLPIDSIQGMRKRTRAGMGGCQGKPWNYGCECRVAQIIDRENQMEDASLVGRRPWKSTTLFPRRWISDEDKSVLQKLSDSMPGEADEDNAAMFSQVEEALPLEVAKVEADSEA